MGASQDPSQDLTAQELEFVGHVIDRKTNTKIATLFNTSVEKVRALQQSVFEKTGLRGAYGLEMLQ